jgi:hypothetical protein
VPTRPTQFRSLHHTTGAPKKTVQDAAPALPPQERVLLDEYVATGNIHEAARRAGVTRSRALSALRSLTWLDELRRAYEAANLTPSHIGTTLAQALEANTQVVVRDGQFTQKIVDVPDWSKRLKAMDMVIQLHLTMAKATPDEGKEAGPVERPIFVTPTEIAGLTREQVLDLVRQRATARHTPKPAVSA